MFVVAVTLTAKLGHERELVSGVRELVHAARGRPGLRYSKVARRMEAGLTQVLVIGEYETSADAMRFAEYDQTAAMPLAPFIESVTGGMFEAVDVEFDADTWQPIFEPAEQIREVDGPESADLV
jgi:hypothetical protein